MLQSAQTYGVKVSVVNVMTMDFGNGQNPLSDAESAAQATAAQLASLYGISTSQAYARMGLTPIAGQNDDNEFFSQSDASTLESFAATHGVAELSFWEVDGYDKPLGYAYSKIFNAITSGGGTGGTSATGPITGYGGLCLDVRGASAANFTAVQVYTCNGTNAQQWTVASGSTLQALGKCLDVDVAGPPTARPWTSTTATAPGPRSGCRRATARCSTRSPGSASTTRAGPPRPAPSSRSGPAPAPPTSPGPSPPSHDHDHGQ